MERQSGVTKLEFAIAIGVIATLTTVLLLRLPYLQAESERLEVEQTVRNIRVGVLQAIGEHVIHGQENRITEVVSSNPIELLETEPAGYRRGTSKPKQTGEWAYDRSTRELAYWPRFPDSFTGATELRWVYAPIVDSSGRAVGAHLVALN